MLTRQFYIHRFLVSWVIYICTISHSLTFFVECSTRRREEFTRIHSSQSDSSKNIHGLSLFHFSGSMIGMNWDSDPRANLGLPITRPMDEEPRYN
jgi:hypothetical protein